MKLDTLTTHYKCLVQGTTADIPQAWRVQNSSLGWKAVMLSTGEQQKLTLAAGCGHPPAGSGLCTTAVDRCMTV